MCDILDNFGTYIFTVTLTTHAVGNSEMIAAHHGKPYRLSTKAVARIDIATGMFAQPHTRGISQRKLHGVTRNTSVREGGVDKKEQIGIGVFHIVTNLDKEVEEMGGVVDMHIETGAVGNLPASFVDIGIFGIVDRAITRSQQENC